MSLNKLLGSPQQSQQGQPSWLVVTPRHRALWQPDWLTARALVAMPTALV
jgi:hypothetical protein